MAATTITLYDVGDVARVTAAFTDNTGAAADPTTVTAKVLDPAGATTNYTVTAGQIVKDTVGSYHLDIACTIPGDWYYRFLGTGAVAAAEEGTFLVREQETAGALLSATALTTLGAAREFVLSNAADGSQDRRIAKLINAYSASVYKYTRREWLPQTSGASRVFNYDGSGVLSLSPFEARAVTGVTLYTDMPTVNQVVLSAGSSTVERQWRANPRGGTTEGTYLWLDLPPIGPAGSRWAFSPFAYFTGYLSVPVPYSGTLAQNQIGFEVTVTGDWGIGVIPDDVEMAVLIAIKDAYENPTAYAAGASGGLQFTEEAEAQTSEEFRARNLPGESRALLSDYRRGGKNQVFA